MGIKDTYRLVTLATIAVLAGLLYSISLVLLLQGWSHELVQALADAMVVALVVSVAVEPRLLRAFGKEIETQTFWASSFLRAPKEYREAIKQLTALDQFSIAAHWRLVFDWGDSERQMMRLTIKCTNYREHRGPKGYSVDPGGFVFESRFPAHPARYVTYIVESPEFDIDLIGDGQADIKSEQDGRLMLLNRSDSSIIDIPPDSQFVLRTAYVTYVDPIGHYPLWVSRPTLRCTIQFGGDALDDLYLSILYPGGGSMASRTRGNGAELRILGMIKVGDVFVTGQAVAIVSWKSTELPSGGSSSTYAV